MRLVVLNDGQTFSSVQGALVVEVEDGLDTDQIEEALGNLDFKVIANLRKYDKKTVKKSGKKK